MKKIMTILTLLFVIQTYTAAANNTKIDAHVEIVLTVPYESLLIQEDGIFVNYEETMLAVLSLERCGENWTVRLGNYCPNGHYVVCRCGGCAISSCGYHCSCYTDDFKKQA